MTAQPGCVVVGAGLAAANVVETLRENGYDGSITLIGDETDRPYERPPLSKDYLQGKSAIDDAYVHDERWFADNNIDTRFGETVIAIDPQAHHVQLASGGTVDYRELVIATGSSARTLDIPGMQLSGVHTLRRIGDSDALRAAFTSGRRVVVIGAGWIGLEVAAAAEKAGCRVTVLEYAAKPLGAVLGDELADHFADLHRSNGVDLRTGVSVSAIVGSGGAVTGVQAGDELLEAEVVVVGVGAKPNVELAVAAGLDTGGAKGNGIEVDERLRTSDPSIYAVGDVANAFNSRLGGRLRVEHWDNAIRQGKLAAGSILGSGESYDWQPYFFTDQFDLGMEYVGHAGPDDDVVIRGDKSAGEFIVFWLSDGRVTAAMNVNIWDVNDDLRTLVGREISPDRLADNDIELTDL
ncbi:MAG: FAD-dependent oxidoreductase [Actinomycetota bacterium]|nr:FAD-dependent oxidoreductase [Actinomycetota bacterium]